VLRGHESRDADVVGESDGFLIVCG
jgi:hypothetical protein